MRRSLLIIIMLAFIVSAGAVTRDNFQATLCENALNQVLQKALAGSELKNPLLTVGKSRFVFEGVYPVLFFEVPLKFIGDMLADNGNIYVNIKEYYENGELKDKATTVDRVNRMVEGLNKYSNENLGGKIQASRVEVNGYASSMFVDMSKFPLVPAMPVLKIRKIVLEEKYLTVASTDKGLVNNKAEIQIYAGQDALNAWIKGYIGNDEVNELKVKQVVMDMTGDNQATVTYSKKDGENSLKVKFGKISLPAASQIKQEIAAKEAQKPTDIETDLKSIIAVLNKALAQAGPQLVYQGTALIMNGDLSQLVKLDLKSRYLSVKAADQQLSIIAQLD
ncbi:MAG: hypothetical protein PHW04_00435 [Candidatus Wallbacteria bacterium]|nr:hypothetical protein [Candidatus Wallbacteria bacterium]